MLCMPPSPMNPAGTGVDAAAFDLDIVGGGNIYQLAATAPAGVLGSALSAAQYSEIEQLILDQVDNPALGLYRLVDATMAVTPTVLQFVALPDALSNTQTFTISSALAGSTPFSVTLAVADSWLTCSSLAASGIAQATPQAITCVADATGLASGVYTTTITITAGTPPTVGGSPQTVQAILTVTENPVLAATPTTLTFTATEGDLAATPASASVTVSHLGPAGTANITWAISGALPAWLSCSSANPSLAPGANGTLTCTPNPSGQPVGGHTASVQLVATASDGSTVDNSPIQLTIQLTIVEDTSRHAGPGLSAADHRQCGPARSGGQLHDRERRAAATMPAIPSPW